MCLLIPTYYKITFFFIYITLPDHYELIFARVNRPLLEKLAILLNSTFESKAGPSLYF